MPYIKYSSLVGNPAEPPFAPSAQYAPQLPNRQQSSVAHPAGIDCVVVDGFGSKIAELNLEDIHLLRSNQPLAPRTATL